MVVVWANSVYTFCMDAHADAHAVHERFAMMMMSSRTLAFGASAPRVRPAARCPLTVTAAYGTTPKVGGGKRWKHTEVNQNGKPVKVAMHVKKGDLVKVRVRWRWWWVRPRAW
jgi:hypothetical protein